jgi:hypothetical protein
MGTISIIGMVLFAINIVLAATKVIPGNVAAIIAGAIILALAATSFIMHKNK